MIDNTEWTPPPDAWFQAKIFYLNAGGWAFARLDNGLDVFIPAPVKAGTITDKLAVRKANGSNRGSGPRTVLKTFGESRGEIVMTTNNSVFEFIRTIVNERVKYRNVDANCSIVFAACADLKLNASVINVSPVTSGAKVRAAIDKVAHQLAISPEHAEGRQQFWRAHPELARVIASDNFFDDRSEEEGDASFDTLEYIFNQPGNREFFPVNQQYQAEQARASAEVVEALALREELLNRFKDENGRLHKTIQPQQFKKEEQRVLNLHIDQLRAEVANVRERKRLAGLSPADLRKEIHNDAVQKQQQAYTERFPQMPKDFYPRGSFTPIPLNRQTLLRIANTDREFFRILTEKYGSAQVDARLQEQQEQI
jgi:hypothetical protein